MSAAVCPAPMQQDNSGSNHRQDQRYFLPSSEDLPSLDAPLFSTALAAACYPRMGPIAVCFMILAVTAVQQAIGRLPARRSSLI